MCVFVRIFDFKPASGGTPAFSFTCSNSYLWKPFRLGSLNCRHDCYLYLSIGCMCIVATAHIFPTHITSFELTLFQIQWRKSAIKTGQWKLRRIYPYFERKKPNAPLTFSCTDIKIVAKIAQIEAFFVGVHRYLVFDVQLVEENKRNHVKICADCIKRSLIFIEHFCIRYLCSKCTVILYGK